MYDVRDTAEARAQFELLPLRMRPRVQEVYERLRHWPQVSGTNPLRESLKGAYRIRTGDWRVLFTVDIAAERIIIFRIDNRRDVYKD